MLLRSDKTAGEGAGQTPPVALKLHPGRAASVATTTSAGAGASGTPVNLNKAAATSGGTSFELMQTANR